MHLRCFLLEKIVANYALIVFKIFGLKLRSCKFLTNLKSALICINLLNRVFDYDYLLLDLDFNILYHFQQPAL